MAIEFTSYESGGMITRLLQEAGGISITEDESHTITFDTSALGGQLTAAALLALLESSDSSVTAAVSGELVNLTVSQSHLSLASIGGALALGSQVSGTLLPAHGGTGSTLFSSGTATFLSAGSVAVADSSITSSSKIVVSQVGSTPAAEEFSVVVNATVGFTIYSTNATSAAVVDYIRVG